MLQVCPAGMEQSWFVSLSLTAMMVFKFSPLHLICCFLKQWERAKIHFHRAGKEDGNSTREFGLPKLCLGCNSRAPLQESPGAGG